MPTKKSFTKEIQDGLDKIMDGAKYPLIIVHTNPDPDAIASAAALKYLITTRYGSDASIGYSGGINRAENRAMVRELNIHLKQIAKINWSKYDRIALVDTQPGSGNNMLPDNQKCDLVLDHHPDYKRKKSGLKIIQPELGVLSTLLIEWLDELGLDITPDLATGLVYAINSESQNLKREVNQRDVNAYLSVYVRANLRKLAQIMTPTLPREYYLSVANTLQKAKTYRNLICANLKSVPAAEMVAEMADFLVRHERISWALCTGRFKDRLIISLRARVQKAEAGKLLRKMVDDPKTVGGHGTNAGGFVDIASVKKNDITILENNMITKFAELHGYDNPDWKSLLDSVKK